jgi:hypothetical protein
MQWVESYCVWSAAMHTSDNRIGAKGATALASALKKNNTLQHLRVGGECRGDAGVCVVCIVTLGVVVDHAM